VAGPNVQMILVLRMRKEFLADCRQDSRQPGGE